MFQTKIKFIAVSIFAILFLIVCGPKTGQDQVKSEAPIVPAKIVWIVGDVKIQSAAGEKKAELGQTVSGADTIFTGANGSVEIIVADSGIIKVSKNSELSVATIVSDSGSEIKVNVNYGKIVTMVRKEQKNSDFKVVTPTALAGVRGTTFLTSVENPSGNKASCAQSGCDVRFAVLEGSVAVTKVGEESEVILDRNRELTLKKNQKLTDKLILSLRSESLKEMKGLIVLKKNDVLEYNRLAEELKASSEELRILSQASTVEDAKVQLQKREVARNNADEVTQTARAVNENKYVQQDMQKERLKLNPKETF
ncbi:sigma factor regulatory protein, FecR/PupR family [Leptospira inadai serovar Lyme str. 10]|uniref:Sigma factor regulatory protein, FecR/PupR family n=2 Tax=Leptospira inadai serovar Lyme TaxID=293084 RepID=V6H932_9LEPT|nr:FecR domain-containing protein [Leptospira inadai]EQA35571.1 sigma factor regulatory protein, FecR/PupR family [Leptospira inadai serovar Lyme str. 10]PNV76072.1 iron dicitrate transport regulator FecR [Leptospira inadai serovar Lyme]